MQGSVDNARYEAEPQVAGDEGHDVTAAVVAIEDPGRGHLERHPGVQVDERSDDDTAEQGVERAGEDAPPCQVIVVRDGSEKSRVEQDDCDGERRVPGPAGKTTPTLYRKNRPPGYLKGGGSCVVW